MTTISGRRTYTEDELQNALQDILSGKLGTRRAAVLYGIPRSTLRNKVYKLAIEQKREANLTAVAPVLADLDDDDKDCSGAEEEKEVERTLNSLPSEDIFRMAAVQGLAAFQKIGKTEEYSGDLQQQQQQHHLEVRQMQQHSPTLSKPQTPALSTNLLDPNIILQGLLISGALSGLTNSKALENTTLGMLPEFFRNILLHNELLKSSEGEKYCSLLSQWRYVNHLLRKAITNESILSPLQAGGPPSRTPPKRRQWAARGEVAVNRTRSSMSCT